MDEWFKGTRVVERDCFLRVGDRDERGGFALDGAITLNNKSAIAFSGGARESSLSIRLSRRKYPRPCIARALSLERSIARDESIGKCLFQVDVMESLYDNGNVMKCGNDTAFIALH